VVGSVPPPQWSAYQQERDLATLKNRRLGDPTAVAGMQSDAGEPKKSRDLSNETDRSGSGLTGHETLTPGRFNSSGLRNRDVTVQRADIITDRRSDAQTPCKDPTGTTELCRTWPCDDTVLRPTGRRPADVTTTSSQRTDRSAAMSTPGSNDRESQSSSRTDKVIRRAAESETIAGDADAHGESLPRSGVGSSSTQPPDSAGTGTISSAAAGKTEIPPPENEVDRPRTFNVRPIVPTPATKPKTHAAQYAANREKFESVKTQPYVLLPSVTETAGRPTLAERNFVSSTAMHGCETATKRGDISVRNPSANSERTGDRNAVSDAVASDPMYPMQVTSSDIRNHGKPVIVRVVRREPSCTQDFSSPNEEKISTNTPVTGKDDVNDGKISEAVTSGTTTDTARYAEAPTLRETTQNSAEKFNVSGSSDTTERTTRFIPKVSRLPRELNQNAPSYDSVSVEQTAGIANVHKTGTTGADVVGPMVAKRVRVDRMLRSVPPVVPPNIRSTGVATPAVQAHKLANTKDASVTGTQAEPRSSPTAEQRKKNMDEQMLNAVKVQRLPATLPRPAGLSPQISTDLDRQPV